MAGLGVSSPFRVASGALAALVLVTSSTLFGCSSDREPVDCSGEPAFTVTVTADEGSLPDDLELEVRYSGSQTPETYRLRSHHDAEVVFCKLEGAAGAGGTDGMPDAGTGAGADSGHGESLACRLWTEGPASVVARGQGYPPVALELQVDEDRCTVAENIELMRGHGGAGS